MQRNDIFDSICISVAPVGLIILPAGLVSQKPPVVDVDHRFSVLQGKTKICIWYSLCLITQCFLRQSSVFWQTKKCISSRIAFLRFFFSLFHKKNMYLLLQLLTTFCGTSQKKYVSPFVVIDCFLWYSKASTSSRSALRHSMVLQQTKRCYLIAQCFAVPCVFLLKTDVMSSLDTTWSRGTRLPFSTSTVATPWTLAMGDTSGASPQSRHKTRTLTYGQQLPLVRIYVTSWETGWVAIYNVEQNIS